MLRAKLTTGGIIALNDEQLGEIVRYMSYQQSGFRDRVRRVFRRSVTDLVNYP